jgi:hypothetical protein
MNYRRRSEPAYQANPCVRVSSLNLSRVVGHREGDIVPWESAKSGQVQVAIIGARVAIGAIESGRLAVEEVVASAVRRRGRVRGELERGAGSVWFPATRSVGVVPGSRHRRKRRPAVMS